MTIQFPKKLGIFTEDDFKKHYDEIIHCLMKFGNMSEHEANQHIEQSTLFKDMDTEMDAVYLFHEEPYYWAMHLIQKDPEWPQDPKLWPPPEGCYD